MCGQRGTGRARPPRAGARQPGGGAKADLVAWPGDHLQSPGAAVRQGQPPGVSAAPEPAGPLGGGQERLDCTPAQRPPARLVRPVEREGPPPRGEREARGGAHRQAPEPRPEGGHAHGARADRRAALGRPVVAPLPHPRRGAVAPLEGRGCPSGRGRAHGAAEAQRVAVTREGRGTGRRVLAPGVGTARWPMGRKARTTRGPGGLRPHRRDRAPRRPPGVLGWPARDHERARGRPWPPRDGAAGHGLRRRTAPPAWSAPPGGGPHAHGVTPRAPPASPEARRAGAPRRRATVDGGPGGVASGWPAAAGAWRRGTTVVGWRGTTREGWPVVARLGTTGGVASRCPACIGRRMASPTRRPVLAHPPRPGAQVWGRRAPRGPMAGAARLKAVRWGGGHQGGRGSTAGGHQPTGGHGGRWARRPPRGAHAARPASTRGRAPRGPVGLRTPRPRPRPAAPGEGRRPRATRQRPPSHAGGAARPASAPPGPAAPGGTRHEGGAHPGGASGRSPPGQGPGGSGGARARGSEPRRRPRVVAAPSRHVLPAAPGVTSGAAAVGRQGGAPRRADAVRPARIKARVAIRRMAVASGTGRNGARPSSTRGRLVVAGRPGGRSAARASPPAGTRGKTSWWGGWPGRRRTPPSYPWRSAPQRAATAGARTPRRARRSRRA